MTDPTVDIALGEPSRLAFTLAADQIKQLMSASTFAITLSMVFMKDTLANKDIIGRWKFRLLSTALFLQACSLLAGYIALGTLTGLLINASKESKPDITDPDIVMFPFLQFLFFFSGLLCGGTFVLWTLRSIIRIQTTASAEKKETTVSTKPVNEEPLPTPTPTLTSLVVA
jgi:hypothetical protein